LILAKVTFIEQSVKVRRRGLFGDVVAYCVKSVIGKRLSIYFLIYQIKYYQF